MRQYISDVIPQSEIVKWKNGDRILITSQTGSGKSQWVKDQLYQFCVDNNKKILLLSNRNILKDQNKNEIEIDGKEDIIQLKNYQTLESSFLYGNNGLFDGFDFIIYDEVHYIFSDSPFNPNTDILMPPLLHPAKDKIFIFLTATPQSIKFFNQKYEYEYTIATDYSYIENLYYYSQDQTVENILQTIPSNEKVIYFSNAKDAYELSNQFDNSAFLCSENNPDYKKRSSRKTQEQIINTNRFDCHFLFTTKVLDNGVNIILPELKHIFIDMTDPIDVIQCLGRKRIAMDTDKVNLYIKDVKGNRIVPMLRKMRERLKLVVDLNTIGKDAFLEKYARKQFDNIIMNNGEVNRAKETYAKYIIGTFSKMQNNKEKKGFQNYINRALLINIDIVKNAELCYEQKNIDSILSSYLGKELYKTEIEEFKNMFFQNLFAPKRKINIRKRGIRCINSILQEDNSDYYIESRTTNTKEHRNQTCWKVMPW
jgi:hypothetical protein